MWAKWRWEEKTAASIRFIAKNRPEAPRNSILRVDRDRVTVTETESWRQTLVSRHKQSPQAPERHHKRRKGVLSGGPKAAKRTKGMPKSRLYP